MDAEPLVEQFDFHKILYEQTCFESLIEKTVILEFTFPMKINPSDIPRKFSLEKCTVNIVHAKLFQARNSKQPHRRFKFIAEYCVCQQ